MKIDWCAVWNAFAAYLKDHTVQFAASPRLDARHYAEQERLYRVWIARSGKAGVPAPNLLVACVLWMTGVAMASWAPRRLLWFSTAATIAWVVRGFIVSRSATDEPFMDDATTEVPIP